MEIWNIMPALLNAVIFYPIVCKNDIEKLHDKTENIIHSEFLIYWVELIDKIKDDSIFDSENRDNILKKFIQFTINSNKDLFDVDKYYKLYKITLKYSVVSTVACVILLFMFFFINKRFPEADILNYNLSITIIILSLSVSNFLLVAIFIFKNLSIGKLFHRYENKFQI